MRHMGNEQDIHPDESKLNPIIRIGTMYQDRVKRWIANGEDPEEKRVLIEDIQRALENELIESALAEDLFLLLKVKK